MAKLKLLRTLLCAIVDKIDKGECEGDADNIFDSATKLVSPEAQFSKEQASTYLNISLRSFDRYKAAGKIPEGKKKVGQRKYWTKSQLDKIVLKS